MLGCFVIVYSWLDETVAGCLLWVALFGSWFYCSNLLMYNSIATLCSFVFRLLLGFIVDLVSGCLINLLFLI